MRRAFAVLLVVLAPVAGVTLSPTTASAQIAVDRLEMYFTPNGTGRLADVFTVMNESKTPMPVSITLGDWDRAENGDNRFYPLGTRAGSCGPAVQVFPQAVTIAPNATQQFRLTIAGPDTMKAACWVIVFAQTQPGPAPKSGRSLSYVLRTGVKVYVHPAALVAEVAVDSLSIRRRPVVEGVVDTITHEAVVRLHNLGGRAVGVAGTMEVRRPDNSVVATIEIPEVPMLPGTFRAIPVALPRLPAGRYAALTVLDYRGADIIAAQIDFTIP